MNAKSDWLKEQEKKQNLLNNPTHHAKELESLFSQIQELESKRNELTVQKYSFEKQYNELKGIFTDSGYKVEESSENGLQVFKPLLNVPAPPPMIGPSYKVKGQGFAPVRPQDYEDDGSTEFCINCPLGRTFFKSEKDRCPDCPRG